MAYYKFHPLGLWEALCPWNPRASRSSDKPSLTMIQQDQSGPFQPACLSQITITGLKPRVQLIVAGRSENLLVHTGATYSVLTSYSGAFSSQTCTLWGATGKTVTIKIYQGTYLLMGWTNIPHTHKHTHTHTHTSCFWWSLGVLLPCWEEIYSLSSGPPLWW